MEFVILFHVFEELSNSADSFFIIEKVNGSMIIASLRKMIKNYYPRMGKNIHDTLFTTFTTG